MSAKPTTIACYAISKSGAKLARKLAELLDVHIFLPEKMCTDNEQSFVSLPLLIGAKFQSYSAHIFIGATGIAVRCIAPHLEHKSLDPAVVVCDEAGQFAISLLSGHWGGGNELAKNIAEKLLPSHGTKAVITTATDVHNLPAIDLLAKECECIILDWEKVKLVNASILNAKKIQLYDPVQMLQGHENLFQPVNLKACELNLEQMAVAVHWRSLPKHEHILRLTMPALCVGIGCKRDCSAQEILDAIFSIFEQANLELKAIACLASVDIKSEEMGLLQAAKTLGVPLRFFKPEELDEAPVLNPSHMAAQLFGLDNVSVSEGAALLAAGNDNASLLVPKSKHNGCVTVAVAIADKFIPEKL